MAAELTKRKGAVMRLICTSRQHEIDLSNLKPRQVAAAVPMSSDPDQHEEVNPDGEDFTAPPDPKI